MELRFLSCTVTEVCVMAEAISHPEVTWQLRNQWLHSLTGLENLQSVEASSSKCEWVSQAGASKSVEPVRVSQLSRCEWVSGASVSKPVTARVSDVSRASVSRSSKYKQVLPNQSIQCEQVRVSRQAPYLPLSTQQTTDFQLAQYDADHVWNFFRYWFENNANSGWQKRKLCSATCFSNIWRMYFLLLSSCMLFKLCT